MIFCGPEDDVTADDGDLVRVLASEEDGGGIVFSGTFGRYRDWKEHLAESTGPQKH